MADMNLKVTPEEIAALSTEVAQIWVQVADSVMAIFKKQNTWEGDSSDQYWENAKNLKLGGNRFAGILMTYIKVMEGLSGIYSSAEMTALSQTQGLPTEGVFK